MTDIAQSLRRTFSPRPPHRLETGLSRAGLIGALGSLALLALLVLWSQVAMIDSAVIAQGAVTVHGQPRPVQNLDGGIVASVAVRNGDTVEADQVLMRLDPTLLQVNLDIYRNRLAEALVRKARLEAEQNGRPAPDAATITASGLTRHLAGLPLDGLIEGQRQIMAARAEVQRGKTDQLTERIKQLQAQTAGIEGLIAATREQLSYTERELANLRKLADQGLARESQVLETERGRADLLGQLASQLSDLAGMANTQRDTELEIMQNKRSFREQVVTDLREVSAQVDELILQIVTTEKQLERVDLRAPVSGIVHELQVTGPGGVVAPGATVMEIVPISEGLEFELRLDPRSVDSVHVGQGARIVFPAFSARTTPQLLGEVTTISPMTVADPVTRSSYYRLQVTIPPAELARLGTRELVPGMPVEAFLDAGARSAWAYLTRPMAEQMAQAFRTD